MGVTGEGTDKDNGISLVACEHSGSFRETSFATIGRVDETTQKRLCAVYRSCEGFKEVIVEAARVLLDEKSDDLDSYGFIELVILGPRGKGDGAGSHQSQKWSGIHSMEELEKALDSLEQKGVSWSGV